MALVVLITLFVLFCPKFSVFAQSKTFGPNECCSLKHDLTRIDPACELGEVVGPPDCTSSAECFCDIDGDDINDAPACFTSVTGNWEACCTIDIIYNTTDWVFYILLSGAVIIFAVAGFLFLVSGGDPGKTSLARTLVFYGMIGLMFAILSKVIPAIIKSVVI